MRVVSLFSGVGGFDRGLELAGMQTVAQVEFEKKCQSVLRRHWPDVPKWWDVSDVSGADLPDADVVAFGSPCQDLSVAGKRAGMADGTRSGLFTEAIRIVKEMQDVGHGPGWVIWENVAGALSSSKGRDFGTVLDKLAQLGAVDIQWRVLDARFFGVPQRRRRVFVIARLDPRTQGRRAVLPVRPRLRRDPQARRQAGEEVAALTANGVGTCGPDDNQAQAGHLIPSYVGSPTTRMLAYGSPEVDGNHYLPVAIPAHLTQDPITGTDDGATPALSAGNRQGCATIGVLAVAENQRGEVRLMETSGSVSGTGGKPGQGYQAVLEGNAVRRLTPRECERLMGWPDDWTRYTETGEEIADSHRYRMCGNGVASPVARWVGERVMYAC